MAFINFVLPMHSPKEATAIKFLHLFPRSLTMLLSRTSYTSTGFVCVASIIQFTLKAYTCFLQM